MRPCPLKAHSVLPDEISRAAYRVIQESVTNALKHATGAAIDIGVECTVDAVTIRVTNAMPALDGSAAPLRDSGGGHGLVGMQKRISALGGTIDAGRDEDGRWQVAASLPLAYEASLS